MTADCHTSSAHCDWQAWRGNVIPLEADLEDVCLILVRACLSSRTCRIVLGVSLTLVSALRLGVVELSFDEVTLDLVCGGLIVALAGVASAVAVVGVVVALVASLGRTGLRVASSSLTSSSAFAAAAAASSSAASAASASASLMTSGVTERQAEDDPLGTSCIVSGLLALGAYLIVGGAPLVPLMRCATTIPAETLDASRILRRVLLIPAT